MNGKSDPRLRILPYPDDREYAVAVDASMRTRRYFFPIGEGEQPILLERWRLRNIEDRLIAEEGLGDV